MTSTKPMDGTDMADYFSFLGKKYEHLVSLPAFAALTTGNVPSTTEGLNTEFYIHAYLKGAELQFDAGSRELKALIISNANSLSHGLKGVTTRQGAIEALGQPAESMAEKKVPVLGVVGGWDKFEVSPDTYLQVLYVVGTEDIRCIYYLKKGL